MKSNLSGVSPLACDDSDYCRAQSGCTGTITDSLIAQNFAQNDYRACESQHECGRAKGPEFVEIARYKASEPKYERHKASTLQPQGKYDQKNCRPIS
jgi:hypothetical protein